MKYCKELSYFNVNKNWYDNFTKEIHLYLFTFYILFYFFLFCFEILSANLHNASNITFKCLTNSSIDILIGWRLFILASSSTTTSRTKEEKINSKRIKKKNKTNLNMFQSVYISLFVVVVFHSPQFLFVFWYFKRATVTLSALSSTIVYK